MALKETAMKDSDLIVKIFETFARSSDNKHVYLIDMKVGKTMWSEHFAEQFGIPTELYPDDTHIWLERIHPNDREEFLRQMDAVSKGETDDHDMVYRARNKEGDYVMCTCRGSMIRDDDGTALYFAGIIDNHSIANEFDPITNLPARTKFLDTVREIRNEGREYNLLFLGLCDFTKINSVYGYEFGISVLRVFSDKLIDLDLAASVYCLGDVKFAMISTAYNEDKMVSIYNDLKNFTMHELVVKDTRISVNLAGSFAHIDNHDIDEHTVLSSGLVGLDESMIEHHGDLTGFDSRGTDIHDKLVLIDAIRSSIINGFDGFYLCFHPIVSSETDKLIGAEALLRWSKEPYGSVPPDRFVAWLESDPLFYDLSNWILRTAMRSWKETVLPINPDLTININLSYMQLEKANFRKDLRQIIEEEEFPTKNLCLELTERCRFMDLDFLKGEIVFLKSLGIKVALDDFGTGFSAMELLIKLPVDTIKIDRSFVINIEDKKENQYVVQSLLDCANNLGVRSTVEGVETASMRDVLKDYGASTLQGYLYSEPVRIADFANLDISGLSDV